MARVHRNVGAVLPWTGSNVGEGEIAQAVMARGLPGPSFSHPHILRDEATMAYGTSRYERSSGDGGHRSLGPRAVWRTGR
jgi:hypothetical protein